MEELVQALGIKKHFRSQVSGMVKHLDAELQAFRSRPLDAGPYTYLWIDALVVKVREDGRTQNVSIMLATAVNRDRDARFGSWTSIPPNGWRSCAAWSPAV